MTGSVPAGWSSTATEAGTFNKNKVISSVGTVTPGPLPKFGEFPSLTAGRGRSRAPEEEGAGLRRRWAPGG